MAKRQDWIKLHTRELLDPDVRALSRAHRDVYRDIQLLSKQYSEENGYLITDGEPMSDMKIARALGALTPAEIAEVLEGIAACLCEEIGLLERVEGSGLHIVNWNLRQAAELRENPENVNKRGKAYRARQRAAAEAAAKAAAKSEREAARRQPQAGRPENVTQLRRDNA